MKRLHLLVCALALGTSPLLSPPAEAAAQALQVAPEWRWGLTGSQPQRADPTIPGTVVFLASRADHIEGFGTYAHARVADLYRGKRVRLSADLRTENVGLRVDGEGQRPSLVFDIIRDRPIRGASEWQRYSVVLEVPEDAHRLAYGVLLVGTGEVWIENLALEVVDRMVPLTGARVTERWGNEQSVLQSEYASLCAECGRGANHMFW